MIVVSVATSTKEHSSHNIFAMNVLTSLCLAAVLVAAVWAEGPNYGVDSYNNPGYGGSGYGDPGHQDVGGYGGYRYGPFRPRMASFVLNQPLNFLDKLFERVRDVQDQMKTYSEQVEAFSAQLSIQEKKLKELVLVVLVELNEIDMKQNARIAKLQGHLADIGNDNVTLYEHIEDLNGLNDENTNLQLRAEGLWATEREVDVRQDRAINTLYTAIRNFKEKLFQIKKNAFEVFFDTVEVDTTLLGSIKKRENRRMCEVGEVTLDADDRRAEYQYQNWFDVVPQLTYGINNMAFNVNNREDPAHYGYGYPPKEPEAIGVRVNAYSTKTGVTLEALDTSFGDTKALSVGVSFQACTIGPGTDPVDH